ncbi:hypothetical protein Ddye_004647 [Dipteronia dyeriana]|uniref:Uncharacterized protein n=1 Tax=Dipteronia dyeriana TaxID=168575 RepID=A0AAE0CXU0_9ROSI|nr:hypothetical protein Ddye_004647 [Dipteronia dyeriana]
MSTSQIENVRCKLGFVGGFCMEHDELKGGLALFWKKGIAVHVKSSSLSHINSIVEGSIGKCWRFIGFYGSPNIGERHHSWMLLRRLSHLFSLMWLCCKDCNEISRWCVGSGSSVKFYKDRLLPGPSAFKPISPRVLPENALVSDLCLSSKAWNFELICNSFLPDDASLILSLPRLSPSHAYTLCWHFNKKRFYSVRSGYRLSLHLADRPQS